MTRDGHDLDDASPSVTLAVGARSISAGEAIGACTTPAHASRLVHDTCDADAPRGTIAALACGDDPHVDTIACLYAVRTATAVELWRRNATFVVADDTPTRVTRLPIARVGSLPLDARTAAVAGSVEHRDVVR